MAFGGEVDDRGDAAVAQQGFDQRGIADVAFHQFGLFHPGDGGAVAGIGQAIEHDHAVIRVCCAQ
jgi:hypothetical protein